MTLETGTVVPAPPVPPSPLGWCSWCLGERDVERPAVTTFSGTALCRECNRTANEDQDDQQDQMAALTAQAGEQLRGLFGGQLPGGGHAGF